MSARARRVRATVRFVFWTAAVLTVYLAAHAIPELIAGWVLG